MNFDKRIQVQEKKKSFFFFLGGGGGGVGRGGGEAGTVGGGEVMNTRAVRVVILVRDTSSRPVSHNCKVL